MKMCVQCFVWVIASMILNNSKKKLNGLFRVINLKQGQDVVKLRNDEFLTEI